MVSASSSSADVPVIAIDGPGGVGKSSTAKRVAERLGYYFLSSGMIYRAMAWHLMQGGWRPEQGAPPAAVAERELTGLKVSVTPDGRVLAGGRDVTAALRELPVSGAASVISTVPAVRAWSNELQRAIVADIGQRRSYAGVVLEGRDIGTVVFPCARNKFFLTANEDVRARRHLKDVSASEPTATLEDVKKSLRARDARDRAREVAPLVPAPDAKIVDTSELSLEGVVETILAALT
jgi:cytidylate kinase